MQAKSYIGHKGVSLDLADGKITWEEAKGTTTKLNAKRLSGGYD